MTSASRFGKKHELSWLLDHGASTSGCSANGQSPLHVAASCGNVDAMCVLLEHCNPADLRARDAAGWMPLHVAAYRGFADNLEDGRPEVVHASASDYHGGYGENIARLILAGADTTARTADDQHLTPYDLASLLGPEERGAYISVLRRLQLDIPFDADAELFWDTCNGECHYGASVWYMPEMHMTTVWLSFQELRRS